jgi:hypothetical protein
MTDNGYDGVMRRLKRAGDALAAEQRTSRTIGRTAAASKRSATQGIHTTTKALKRARKKKPVRDR